MINKVFIVNNEFHLFVFLVKYFKLTEFEKKHFKLIITKQPISRRLVLDKLDIPLEYLYIEDRFSEFTIKDKGVDYFSKIEKFCNYDIKELIVFHDSLFLNSLIISETKKNYKNAIVKLTHEGVAGYYKRKYYFTHLKRYIPKYLYYKYYLNYSSIDFVVNWGQNKKVDQMEMLFPARVYNPRKLPIKKLELNSDGNILEKIRKVYRFKEQIEFKIPNNKVAFILSLGMSKRTYHLKEKEITIIENIVEIVSNKGFTPVLKIKSNENIDDFSKIRNKVKFITSSFPAELITLGIQDSLIISWNSSANLINNYNKSFWLYPLLGMKKIVEPFDNIEIIENLERLKNLLKNN